MVVGVSPLDHGHLEAFDFCRNMARVKAKQVMLLVCKVLTWWLNTDVDIHEWSGADSLLVLGENELVLPPEVGSVVRQHETLVQVLPEVSCKRKQNI